MLKKNQVEAFSCSSFCSLRKLRFFYRKILFYCLLVFSSVSFFSVLFPSSICLHSLECFCSLRKLRFFISRFFYCLLVFYFGFFFFITVSEFHLFAFFLLLSPRVASYLCVLHVILVTFTVFTVPLSFIVRFLMFRCLFATFSSLLLLLLLLLLCFFSVTFILPLSLTFFLSFHFTPLASCLKYIMNCFCYCDCHCSSFCSLHLFTVCL